MTLQQQKLCLSATKNPRRGVMRGNQHLPNWQEDGEWKNAIQLVDECFFFLFKGANSMDEVEKRDISEI